MILLLPSGFYIDITDGFSSKLDFDLTSELVSSFIYLF